MAGAHDFQAGDRVRSSLSGRSGIVRRLTQALVLVDYDDRDSNVDYAEAPNAWIPHSVLEKISTAHVLHEPADFSQKICEQSALARAVVNGGLGVCKLCGAIEIELYEYPTCEDFRGKGERESQP